MDVVIFCGGRGTRLSEKTAVIPKPLVKIGEQPILWHIMKIYSHFGHNRFILTLGYKGDEIRKYIKDYVWLNDDIEVDTSKNTIPKSKENWRIVLANTGEDSKTQKRLFLVKKFIKSKQFMVTYGDGVSDINIDKLIKQHNYMRDNFGTIGTITVTNPRSKFGIVETKNGLVKSFKEKPIMKEFVNIGFMIFEKEVLDMIDDENIMFVNGLLPKLSEMGKLAYYHNKGFWECMDTYKDYITLNELWKNKKPWKIWD